MAERSARQLALARRRCRAPSALAAAGAGRGLFSSLFGAFGARPRAAPQIRCRSPTKAPSRRRSAHARPRYRRRPGLLRAHLRRPLFPDHGVRQCQSRAASCNSFCPASETKMVYGSNIDNAATENGKPYSELPNAFRYRTEIVAGCTCNGKDQFGLAPVKIENDPTLRKGDIVAGADGLMVAGRGADKRGAR